ncbi:uncharacterized protein FIBRA_07705 [Fibroporia radiculosa]|uniref:Uncharacterized protein n=1 Tax=Fibroporia radiculosa TaxID=599839 RepID=J4H4S2_9APHY|nr:uncharacterized protein FIBRA_07705 [Fibroporia radiculosa]CCM05484.1 predicted protein [Fibroporia radiculosa]
MSYKYDKLSSMAPAKALAQSRNVVQSAKRKSRHPVYPEVFEPVSFFQSLPQPAPPMDPYKSWRKNVFIWSYRADGVAPFKPVKLHAKLYMPRNMPDVNRDVINAIEPDLANISMESVNDAMKEMGGKLMGAFKHFIVDPPKSLHDKELDVLVTDIGLTCVPTHVFAVFASAASQPDLNSPSERASHPGSEPRKVIFIPIHALPFVTACGNLPPMTKSDPKVSHPKEPLPSGQGGLVYRLPVVPLRLARMEGWDPLVVWLYSRNKEVLMRTLLPMPQLGPIPNHRLVYPTSQPAVPRELRIAQYAPAIIEACNNNSLEIWRWMVKTNCLYLNAMSLAIKDPELWEVMGIAWESIIGALNLIQSAALARDASLVASGSGFRDEEMDAGAPDMDVVE